jgi:hypothetical protein
MAKKVLTTASTVRCSHNLPVKLTSTATLRVGNAPVIRQVDLATRVFGCAAQQAPCTSLTASQTSAVLRDDGSPVVLAAGLSTNNGACTITAEHDILQE